VSPGSCSEPEDDAGQDDPAAIVDCLLVVAGGDPAPLLEPVEAALDDVAALVGGRVKGVGPAAGAAAATAVVVLVGTFWNGRGDPAPGQQPAVGA
jgi:hypothetical protein